MLFSKLQGPELTTCSSLFGAARCRAGGCVTLLKTHLLEPNQFGPKRWVLKVECGNDPLLAAVWAKTLSLPRPVPSLKLFLTSPPGACFNMGDEQEERIVFMPEEIETALASAGSGIQRLRRITKQTRYYFCTTARPHYSACEIVVAPFQSETLMNVLFVPTQQRYTLCCDKASEHDFEQLHQLIYDALIRPVQWDFSNSRHVALIQLSSYLTINSTRVLPTGMPPGVSCEEKGVYGLGFLQRQTQESQRDVQLSFLTGIPSSASTENRSQSTSPVPDTARPLNTMNLSNSSQGYRKRRAPQNVATGSLLKKLKKTINQKQAPKSPTCLITTIKVAIAETESSRVELAHNLMNLGSSQAVRFGPICWANKFYSINMTYILEEKKISSTRQQDMSTVVGINRAAVLKCQLHDGDPCHCGLVLYNAFAGR